MADKKNGAAAKKPQGGMTKMDAVRKALEELGKDAFPVRIRDHLKDRYGVTMTADHVSVCKGKILKKEAGKGKPTAPKPAATEPAAAKPQFQASAAKKEEPKKAPAADISKTEAVRRAMRELGTDAGPTRIQGFVKDRFGIEMTPNHVSDCKGKILKQEAAAAKPAAAKPAAPKPPAQPSAASKTEPEKPAKPAAAPQGNGIGLEDIETAKGLVERVGADSLRKLIDVLAR